MVHDEVCSDCVRHRETRATSGNPFLVQSASERPNLVKQLNHVPSLETGEASVIQVLHLIHSVHEVRASEVWNLGCIRLLRRFATSFSSSVSGESK